jgi:hypothetical protein
VIARGGFRGTSLGLSSMAQRVRTSVVVAFTLSATMWLGGAAPALAAITGENVDKAMHAVRTTTPPTIDGRLDDVAWQAATPDDRFVQMEPQNGRPASERTEVRIVYDDHAIYVGIRCHDREPDRIVSRLTRRDRQIEADWIAIGFDSRHEHASAYAFMLNAAGVQSDLLLYDDTNASTDWDAVWDGAVARDAGGWSAEFRIPLSVLRFSSAPEQVWGFNVERYISRKKENLTWSHVPQGVNANVSRWGHVDGIAGIRPRRTFELRPYVAASARVATPTGGAFLGHGPESSPEGTAEAGLDLKLGLTSRLTLDATVNPDFGQVEADPAVLNLSRFETFFPEKRPFFLEGADIFELPIQVFYSRRIGRPPSGLGIGDTIGRPGHADLEIKQAPSSLRLWTAAKLTGTVSDGLTLGVLDAITGSERFRVEDPETQGESHVTQAPPRNYAALRARYSLGGASSVGLLATAVTWFPGDIASADVAHDAYVQSADTRWAADSGSWSERSQVVLSERVGGPGRDDDPILRPDGTRMLPGDVGVGAFSTLEYSSQHAQGFATLRTLSPHLDVNDFGFVQQNNQHLAEVGGGWRDNEPSGAFIRRFIGGSARAVFDWYGVPSELSLGGSAEATWSNYWGSGVSLRLVSPGLWNPYETGDGAYLERLPYLNWEGGVDTDGRKPFSAGLASGGGHALGDPAYYLWNEAKLAVNGIPQTELELGASFFYEAHDLRNWFDGPCVDATGADCTIDTDARTYRMAEITDGSLSLTLRGSYTLSTTLSFQAYAQLFMDEGWFARRRVIAASGHRPKLYRSQLATDPLFTGDEDGDGKVDDGFQDTSLNVNLVLRWEVSPGSTILGVYTRAQNADYDLTGLRPRFRVTGLDSGRTEEVLLMKLVYFYGS